ncbi:MAG TPA: hypothetical protein VMK82_01915 [Steroidobacteraceae bacterium]|nr:hypothetical protein [Steroidobacteraceae bacterium]
MNDVQDSDYPLLARNDPVSDGWEDDSVLGRLMEDGLFDATGYADLEAAMIDAASGGPHFETLGVVARIIERVTLMTRRHVDPGDAYRIENLDDEQVAELDRRVRFCLLEISLGNEPDMSRWEL